VAAHGLTPSQTVGPFFHDCLLREGAWSDALADSRAPGTRIRVRGVVSDGDGEPVPDAVLEIWQADATGQFSRGAPSSFKGFGRFGTDDAGRFSFTTIRPGAVPSRDGSKQAPHISVAVFARGLMNHLYTRIYFDGDPANPDDPTLRLVPEHRRGTLIARAEPSAGDAMTQELRFDIVLQGENETVFFDFRTSSR
jgi:protocatechuate 3,4-dioxygenase, alpha subunit